MNPALPLLALLTAAGAAGLARAGRAARDFALPWALVGFAGTALLAPALRLPDGIPSPAATLAQLPPWLGTGSPADGNPLLRDVTFQIEPWLLFLRGELHRGRLPLWNPHQFAGTPFWANGQSAPLFPLHLLFAVLPLGLGFVLLPWLRFVLAGCGAWALARALGLGRPGAAVAALLFPLSGMLVSFLLFPMGNALALVPWVLWAVERLASGRGAAALALLTGAQLLGGHPETSIHTALLSALYLLVRGAERPARAWMRFAAAWAVGTAIAAVHLLPLALLLPATSKWQAAGGDAVPPLALRLAQPLRLVLPQLYGHPALGTWWGPFNYSATAVYAGATALPLAAAGLPRLRADRRWAAVAALLAFSFLAAYHLPGVRELLTVPPLGRIAHHRLIFGIELALALLAGAGCDRWLGARRAGRATEGAPSIDWSPARKPSRLGGGGRGIAAGAAVVAALLTTAWLLFHDDWSAHGLLREQILWTAAAAAVALLLVASLALRPERRWRLLPPLLTIICVDLLAAHGRILGRLPLPRLYPETPAVRFLRAQEGRVAGVGEALRPNAATVYGLADVRGDDPIKLARYERLYSRLASPDPVYSQPIERWDDPWLDRLGVRWVVAAPAAAPPSSTWRLAFDGPEARVWERPTALPLVRWGAARNGKKAGWVGTTERSTVPPLVQSGSGPAGKEEKDGWVGTKVLDRRPGFWDIAWSTPRPRQLLVAESFEKGWRATVDGQPAAIEAVDGVLLGVRLPAGEGRLTLRYRPPGLLPGAALSVAGLALALVWLISRPTPLAPARDDVVGDSDAQERAHVGI